MVTTFGTSELLHRPRVPKVRNPPVFVSARRFNGGVDADRAIAAIADRQHGLITLDQALLAGLTRAGAKHRVGTGRWERLHPGVYRMAGSARTFEQEVLAACRAVGPGATASHRSAAALLDLPGLTRKTELTVVCEHAIRLQGVTVHRSVRLDRADRFRV